MGDPELNFFPEDPRDYLKLEYHRRHARRPHYSKRAFARDLDLSPSALVEFLNGKLPLSKPRVRSLAKVIQLSIEQTHHWMDLMDLFFSKNKVHKEAAQTRIANRRKDKGHYEALDFFEFISEWSYWAYLELLEMNPIYQDDKLAADFLSLPLRKIKTIRNKLLKFEFIESYDGGVRATGKIRILSNFKSPEAAQKYHQTLISKAVQAIHHQTLDERFLSSLTCTVRKQDIPAIGKLLEKTIVEVLTPYCVKDERDSVYACTIQLYDLAKSSRLKKG